ncbi:MAG: DEAD/DEAH box helicase, partial [Caldilineaceae bacterium]
ILVAPVGFGKAITGLTAACARLDTGLNRRILVVAPLKVAELVWLQESEKWQHVTHTVALALGSPKQRAAAIESGAEIVVINIENIGWLIENYPDAFDGMIIDELSKMKDVGGSTARAMRSWVKRLNWRVGMSATPVAESSADLYGQSLLIDLGKALGTRKEAFLTRYFTPTDYERRSWQLVHAQALAAAMKDLVYVVDDTEYAAELPGLTLVEHMLVMPTEVAELYHQMAEHSVAMGVAAGSAAIRAGKLRQIASGGLYGEEGALAWFHPWRLDFAIELIKASATPMLVVYEFSFQLEYLRDTFPDALVLGDGQKFRGPELARWSAGEVPVLLMHVRSAAHGLNLQYGGHRMLVITPVWGSDPWQQVIGRIRRRGQPAPAVLVHELLAHATDDMKFRLRLDDKAVAEKAFMGMLM